MVGGHAKTAFLRAAISAAAHQRQRRHGLKKKSTAQIRLRRILENTVRLRIRLTLYRGFLSKPGGGKGYNIIVVPNRQIKVLKDALAH